jgi:hypothetical protein
VLGSSIIQDIKETAALCHVIPVTESHFFVMLHSLQTVTILPFLALLQNLFYWNVTRTKGIFGMLYFWTDSQFFVMFYVPPIFVMTYLVTDSQFFVTLLVPQTANICHDIPGFRQQFFVTLLVPQAANFCHDIPGYRQPVLCHVTRTTDS